MCFTERIALQVNDGSVADRILVAWTSAKSSLNSTAVTVLAYVAHADAEIDDLLALPAVMDELRQITIGNTRGSRE